MSRKQYRARSKKVQKLGRDGLEEQDQVTGQEERISQRAADVSFGPKRSQEQAAGRASPQRTPAQGKRWKQPRPSPPQEPDTPAAVDAPDAPEIVPTMRQADDVPLAAPTTRSDGTTSRKRRQQKRANRLNQDAPTHSFTEDSADGGRLHFEPGRDPPADPVSQEGPEPAAPRGADDVPMRKRPPGRRTPLSAQSRAETEDGGRLQFEEDRAPPPADPDTRTQWAAETDTPVESPSRGGTSAAEPTSKPDMGLTRRQHKQYEKAERRVEQSSRRLEKAQAKLPTRRRAHLEKEYDANTGKVRHRLRFEAEVEPETVKPTLPAQVGRTVKMAAVMKLHGKIRETERQNVAVEAAHKGEFVAERGAGRFLRWNRQRLRSKPYRAVRQAERRLHTDQTRLAWQTALRDNPELRRKNALAK